MLQIRLNKGSSSDGTTITKQASVDTVTVACPDHLVIANLPVAKSLGTITSASIIKTVGRRSRRLPGERVHFCVRCDFPIAIYGRLSPCEHAFCLVCARSDSSCYLCDERIQKIQTIKMLEGIFVCAAPHCLKSFLKRSDFEAHINEVHADLLQPNTERESNDVDTSRSSSAEAIVKQMQHESSTVRVQSRPGFSFNPSQPYEDKFRRPQIQEQPPPNVMVSLGPPVSYKSNQLTTLPQSESNPVQSSERSYNRSYHENFDPQGGPSSRFDSDPSFEKQLGTPSDASQQTVGFPSIPVNLSKGPNPAQQINYPPSSGEGNLTFYNPPHEIAQSTVISEGRSEQGPLLSFPPTGISTNTTFPDVYPRPWSMGAVAMQFESSSVGQGIPEGYTNSSELQGRVPFFPVSVNPPDKWIEHPISNADLKDGKGVLAPAPLAFPHSLPLPLPPPPPFPLPQTTQGRFSGPNDLSRDNQNYGWKNDKRIFSSQD